MKCLDCPSAATVGQFCLSCVTKRRERGKRFSAARYKRRIAAGECVGCGKPNELAPRRYCFKCAVARGSTGTVRAYRRRA